jgi:hypothetical protein
MSYIEERNLGEKREREREREKREPLISLGVFQSVIIKGNRALQVHILHAAGKGSGRRSL